MPAEAPPLSVLWQVHDRVPGIWTDFVNRVVDSAAAVQPGDGLVITSWWRDPGTNRRVGGHPESQHLAGLALDVSGPGWQRFGQRARANFTVVEYATHVHLQYWGPGVLRDTGLLRTLYA